jgi:hypothetical protein
MNSSQAPLEEELQLEEGLVTTDVHTQAHAVDYSCSKQ